jgi:conjugal transfer pilus assembly protein TraW
VVTVLYAVDLSLQRQKPRWRQLVGALAADAALLVLCLLAVPAAQARDLGVIGPVHEIAEPDMLLDILTRLRAKEASGELARLEESARKRALQRIHTPEPVAGLRRAQVARQFHFDPSVRFDEPVLDDKGRVVVPAGTLANPLRVVGLRSQLLFFDGRDPVQVRQARREVEAARSRVTPILVGGSPLDLGRQWSRQIYFDQGGRMVRHFGIQAVPARVSQDGQLLLVQEFPPQ